jgi:phenylalanyl-tRNA synthetase beta chain
VKIVVSWLREFVDVTASPEALGEMLTLRGFELSALERVGVEDVLDFEVTANRPDALSVIGFAREAGTAYSLPLKPQVTRPLTTGPTEDVNVTLEAPDLCPRYAAAVADVTIGPSPGWLAARLQAAGVRPINNVVDVTNYVLLELGQPMHAFDLHALAGGEIRVRRAAPGERITTLDGVDRALDPEMLVIADAERAQAIAGVMGGGRSEVRDGTKTIVLESAFFDPRSIRRTSKKLGLKTEASSRFERGADIDAAIKGIERAMTLLEDIGAGAARGGTIDRYPSPVAPRKIALRGDTIRRLLGYAIEQTDVERILKGLGFQVAKSGAGWDVAAPTFRVDVLREADLVEEVARHYGYDRLPSTFPPLTAPPARPDPAFEVDRVVRKVMLAAGCSEALTFSFIDAAAAAQFADQQTIVSIANPLSAQFSVLRPSLLPGLLASVAHNRHRERTDVRLFEIGATMTRSGESRRVAVALTGSGNAHWSAADRAVDFFDAKGIVEAVTRAAAMEVTFNAASAPPYLTRGRAATIAAAGRVVGAVGMLTPAIVVSAGLSESDEIYVAVLDLDAIIAARSPHPLKVAPLPRYPSSARDISIVVDEILPAETVRGTIRATAPDTLVSVREFDRYQGKGVPDGRVSLSLRLSFRSPDRTLTDAEVESAMKEILTALKSAHNAVQR